MGRKIGESLPRRVRAAAEKPPLQPEKSTQTEANTIVFLNENTQPSKVGYFYY
jgi:hypothetical protein